MCPICMSLESMPEEATREQGLLMGYHHGHRNATRREPLCSTHGRMMAMLECIDVDTDEKQG